MSWDKKMSQRQAVKSFMVKNGDKINVEASVAKFKTVLLQHLVSLEVEDGLIKECVSKVFDQYKGASLNMQYLVSQTLMLMVQRSPEFNEPVIYSKLGQKITEFVRENSGAEDSKPYAVKLGQYGGFFRKADQ